MSNVLSLASYAEDFWLAGGSGAELAQATSATLDLLAGV
jgi:hypothetical protein